MSEPLEPAAVEVLLSDGPLGPPAACAPTGGGAWLVFEGVVRPVEGGRPLAALVYEAYEPMTSRELRRLAAATLQRHGLLSLRVEHSVGRVAVGEASFRLSIGSTHRAEGLRATGEFIDAMKRDVPLWKTPEWGLTAGG
jgi:molybdopterin synthase catalytic subunit